MRLLCDAVRKAEALEACHGQDDRVEVLALKLLQARVDIAAQVRNIEVRPCVQELRLAAQARGADLCALRQILERLVHRAHHSVPRIKSLRDGRDHEALRHLCRHVLEAVHRDVDAALEHLLLELFREEPLAADLGERRVEDLVALCRHELLLDAQIRIALLQAVCHIVCLPERELTAARPDNDCAVLHSLPPPLSCPA